MPFPFGRSPRPKIGTVRVCRRCGCTDTDCRRCLERSGHRCWWVQWDLCSACAPAEPHEAEVARRLVTTLGPCHAKVVLEQYPGDEVTQGYVIDAFLAARRQLRGGCVSINNAMRCGVACELISEAIEKEKMLSTGRNVLIALQQEVLTTQ